MLLPKRFFLYALSGLVFLALSAFVFTWVTSPLVVTVTGGGDRLVLAQNASLVLAVSETDLNPETAATNARARADYLRNILTTGGVKAEDIFESQSTVEPLAAVSSQGYRATISLGAKINDVVGISSLVTTLYENGALYVSQPVLSLGDAGQAEKEALAEAMKDAQSRARDIAFRQRKLIKKIVAIAQTPTNSATSVTSSAGNGSEQVPGMPMGNLIKVQKTVSVTYKMW